MSIFFKDLGKKAKDLLGKNYTTGENREFSIKTKTADDITYAAETTITGADVKGKVKVDFKVDNVKFKTLSLDSNGCVESDVHVSNVLDNVVFTLSGKSQSLTSHMPTTFGVEYSHEDFKANFVASPFGSAAGASICYKSNDLFLGGAAGFQAGETFEASAYEFGVGYAFDDNFATLKVSDKLSKLMFSGHRQHSEDVALAATLTSNLKGDNFFPKVELGGSFKIDSDTSVFGKVSVPNCGTKDVKASFSLDQKLNANAKLSLTSVLDLDPEHPRNFFGSEFGLSLKFGA